MRFQCLLGVYLGFQGLSFFFSFLLLLPCMIFQCSFGTYPTLQIPLQGEEFIGHQTADLNLCFNLSAMTLSGRWVDNTSESMY